MNHEDEVRITIVRKIAARAKRRVRAITIECGDDPCECRKNLYLTLNAIMKLGTDVFKNGPEYYTSIAILGAATQEIVEEMNSLKNKKVIHL